MKLNYTIIFLILLTFQLNGQENVFVLIDVSKSGARLYKEIEGENLILDIVSAGYSNSKYPEWKVLDETISDINIKKIIAGNGASLISNNSIVGLIEIGDYNRHLEKKSFSRISSSNSYSDFIKDNYPKDVWKDNNTIIDLPVAWLASFLKSQNLKEYYLFILSDEQQDKGNPGSKIQFSQEDNKLIADYGKGSRKPEKICTLNANLSNAGMFLTIWKIDLSSNPIPPNNNTGIIIPPPETCIIELTSLKGGTSTNPIEVKGKQITISWFCKNAPDGAQYKIRFSPVDNQNQKAQSFTSSGNSYNIANILDGKWRISITPGSDNFVATSANTIINVNTGGNLWFIWLLLIAGFGYGGYWYWKKTQNDKLKKLNSISDTDSFISGSTINTKSENSGYF
jgi:hypothetical protein